MVTPFLAPKSLFHPILQNLRYATIRTMFSSTLYLILQQILLFKTTYENNDYYIELIEGGNVYDIKNNVVKKALFYQLEDSLELYLLKINESVLNCLNNIEQSS